MAIEDRLRTHLLAYAPLAALVGTRVYAMYVPDNVPMPAIAYNFVTDQGFFTLGGMTKRRVPRVQLSIVSTNVSQVALLSEMVKTAFNGWAETFTELVVEYAYAENAVDIEYTDYIPVRYVRMTDVVISYRSV